MISKTTGRYVLGTVAGIFIYEVLDATGLVDRGVRMVTDMLGLR